MEVHYMMRSLPVLVWSLTLLAFSTAPALAQQPPLHKPDESDEFFKGDKLRKFTITVDEENFKILKKDPRKYVRANFTDGSKGIGDIGIHLKGAAGSFRGFEDKPALTMNIDKFTKHQRYRDLDKIHANNSVQDPSFCNELICGELARMMGIPAARTTHTVVELNGKKKGLYIVKEGFNKTFLKQYFKNISGNLYDGGFLQDIDGELYQNAGSEGLDKREDLKALVKACREGDPKKRFEEVSKLLEMDRFISMMVFDALCAHWDGYTSQKNNYRLYHDPDTNKITFFVHGMDQMFQRTDWSIWPATNGMVSRVIWETEEGKKRYEARLREVVAKYFKTDWMHRRIDEVVSRVKPFAEKEMDKNTANDFESNAKNFKQAIKSRVEFVEKELAKKK